MLPDWLPVIAAPLLGIDVDLWHDIIPGVVSIAVAIIGLLGVLVVEQIKNRRRTAEVSDDTKAVRERVEHEFQPNSGKSMRDSIDRVEWMVTALFQRHMSLETKLDGLVDVNEHQDEVIERLMQIARNNHPGEFL